MRQGLFFLGLGRIFVGRPSKREEFVTLKSFAMGKKEGLKRKEEGFRNGGGGSSGRPVGPPVEDSRFSRIHSDPRFQRLPKNKAKVAIDSRFAGMFSEKGFKYASVDKRGIKSKNSSQNADPLLRYYKIDEEEEEELDASVNVEKPVIRKKRGKKDRVKKELKASGNVEFARETVDIDQGGKEEARVDEFGERKRKEKREKVRKKLDSKAKVEIDQGLESEEENGELNEISEIARPGELGILGKWESDEYSEGAEESGLEEGEEEEEGDEEDSQSSSSSSESEDDVEEEVSEAEEEEKVPTTNTETKRLALMNMDWEHIQAVHLLVLMRSFVPKGGRVDSVSVYPSEFGIEQMKEEDVHGPKNLFKKKADEDEEEEDDDEADTEKLRKYEKAKLRYYYAVVECDSASTAAFLYDNCDGLEFERTSNTLDLRYIPDEMEFKRAPRDVATEVPTDYKPIEFETRALQHSNVRLTWDDDEPVRVKALRRNFNREELNEMDFRAYVASSSESESEDGEHVDLDESGEPNAKEKVRSKYMSLLTGTGESDNVLGKKAEKGNIEIKFHTGLDELSEILLQKTKKDKADETVWEAYLRRKKEKKKARRNKNAGMDSDISDGDEGTLSDGGVNHKDDPFFSHDDDPFNDPFFQQDDDEKGPTENSKKVKDGVKEKKGSSKEEERKKTREDAARDKKEAEKKQAELELLLLDDHMVQNGGEVQKIPSLEKSEKKQQKAKKKKGTKGKAEELQEKILSSANYEDPRFASLFTSHHFAIDPTDPHFKKTGSYLGTIAEKQRQKFQSFKKTQQEFDSSGKQDEDQCRKRKAAELSSLVRSLKSKVQTKRGKVF